jgi:hypothetical protein
MRRVKLPVVDMGGVGVVPLRPVVLCALLCACALAKPHPRSPSLRGESISVNVSLQQAASARKICAHARATVHQRVTDEASAKQGATETKEVEPIEFHPVLPVPAAVGLAESGNLGTPGNLMGDPFGDPTELRYGGLPRMPWPVADPETLMPLPPIVDQSIIRRVPGGENGF